MQEEQDARSGKYEVFTYSASNIHYKEFNQKLKADKDTVCLRVDTTVIWNKILLDFIKLLHASPLVVDALVDYFGIDVSVYSEEPEWVRGLESRSAPGTVELIKELDFEENENVVIYTTIWFSDYILLLVEAIVLELKSNDAKSKNYNDIIMMRFDEQEDKETLELHILPSIIDEMLPLDTFIKNVSLDIHTYLNMYVNTDAKRLMPVNWDFTNGRYNLYILAGKDIEESIS